MKKVRFSFERNPVGIIFRAFVLNESQLPERIALTKTAIDKALGLVINGKNAFKQVTVLIPSDKRYPSCDCGKTAQMLREIYLSEKRVEILETMGDIFCSALNFGVAKQAANGIDYSLIASPDVHSYLTEENVSGIFEKAKLGARVVGLAIHELNESIHHGCIANTFALWHIESLQAVGMFNIPLSGESKSDKEATFLSGHDETGQDVFYKINGVEEIIPALLMYDHFKEPFIGVVDPVNDGHYQVVSDPAVIKRHQAKMATKLVRQQHQAFGVGYDLNKLKYAVMK